MAVGAKGKLLLSGFNLNPGEKVIFDNIIQGYIDRIDQRFKYEEIRLRLKKAQRGKAFLHEVQGTLLSEGKYFKANKTGYNLLSTLAEVFEKMMVEIEHKKRRARQNPRRRMR